jgi:hypothetical protein
MKDALHRGRWFRHLATDESAVRRLFGGDGLQRVE